MEWHEGENDDKFSIYEVTSLGGRENQEDHKASVRPSFADEQEASDNYSDDDNDKMSEDPIGQTNFPSYPYFHQPSSLHLSRKNEDLKRQIKAIKLQMMRDELQEETEQIENVLTSALTMIEERDRRSMMDTLRDIKQQNDKMNDFVLTMMKNGRFMTGSFGEDSVEELVDKPGRKDVKAGPKVTTNNSPSKTRSVTLAPPADNGSNNKSNIAPVKPPAPRPRAGSGSDDYEQKNIRKAEIVTGNDVIDSFFREREIEKPQEHDDFDLEEEKEERERLAPQVPALTAYQTQKYR